MYYKASLLGYSHRLYLKDVTTVTALSGFAYQSFKQSHWHFEHRQVGLFL